MASSNDIIGRVEEERGLTFLLNGDARLAEASAGRALARFAMIHDPAGEGEALRVLGLVALAEGRMEEGRARLERALERAREAGGALLEAETSEALAIIEESAGAAARAEEYRAAASGIFEAIGATACQRTRDRVAKLYARSRLPRSL
jgi:tetratricopeptide (TPR) repeat protein